MHPPILSSGALYRLILAAWAQQPERVRSALFYGRLYADRKQLARNAASAPDGTFRERFLVMAVQARDEYAHRLAGLLASLAMPTARAMLRAQQGGEVSHG